MKKNDLQRGLEDTDCRGAAARKAKRR